MSDHKIDFYESFNADISNIEHPTADPSFLQSVTPVEIVSQGSSENFSYVKSQAQIKRRDTTKHKSIIRRKQGFMCGAGSYQQRKVVELTEE